MSDAGLGFVLGALIGTCLVLALDARSRPRGGQVHPLRYVRPKTQAHPPKPPPRGRGLDSLGRTPVRGGDVIAGSDGERTPDYDG